VEANVQEELETLDDIYRFAVEQTGMARGELLELMIVLILVFEARAVLHGHHALNRNTPLCLPFPSPVPLTFDF
jgi:hypothetical protein